MDWKLPDEIVAATGAFTGAESDLFTFGRFPEVSFENALGNARRRWDLALKFDQALRSFTVEHFENDGKILWPPAVKSSLHDLAKDLGIQDPEEAQTAWLHAIWLWPDRESQESAAYRISALDVNGDADEIVAEARLKLRIKSTGGWTPTRRSQVNVALKNQAVHSVKNVELFRMARVRTEYLHPELWSRYVVLLAKSNTRSRRWREMARDQLGKVVPERSLGHEALERIGNVALVFRACFFWVELHKKSPILENLSGFSSVDRACELTAKALRERHPPALSARTIRRVVERSGYLKDVKKAFKAYLRHTEP